MHTLISFLGKSKLNPNTGYEPSTYQLNGKPPFKAAFFGLGLANHIIRPDKLIVIGTSGSMWDVFFDNVSEKGEHVVELVDKVQKNEVDESFLKIFESELKEKLGYQVKFIVMKYARNEQEQIELLEQIANEVQENDEISIDVTHSFRHLPILGLVVSRFLKNVKNVETKGIYYGARDMTENRDSIAPVVELNGTLKMLDWVDALSAYNQNGDYQVFSPLFKQENAPEYAKLLEDASYSENINQIDGARSALTKFRRLPEMDNPLMKLFNPELKKRTKWAEEGQYANRQLQMAEFYFGKGDFLRTSILVYEAWVSKMVYKDKGDPADYKRREKIEKKFIEKLPKFKKLKNIRNALAHGTKSEHKDVRDMLEDKEKLKAKLKEYLQEVQKWQ